VCKRQEATNENERQGITHLFHPMKHISTREERRRGLEYEKYRIECDPVK
jgi:hypothetical protein